MFFSKYFNGIEIFLRYIGLMSIIDFKARLRNCFKRSLSDGFHAGHEGTRARRI